MINSQDDKIVLLNKAWYYALSWNKKSRKIFEIKAITSAESNRQ